MIREIDSSKITEAVRLAFAKACVELPDDIQNAIFRARSQERNESAGHILELCLENAKIAKRDGIPICQDTGLAVVFVELGQDVHINGELLPDAINRGVAMAYTGECFRASVVRDPLYHRVNTENNTPAVIHTRITAGDKIRITAVPKGFGAENMSAVKMFTPAATEEDIIDFAANTLKAAGGNSCPPTAVGIGIGGDFEYCAVLAKEALTLDAEKSSDIPEYAQLERKILRRINGLDIGPQGLSGDSSALSVRILTYPTHIAGLPVAVNVSCHVTRHYSVEI